MFSIFHHLNINHVFFIKVEHTSGGEARVKSSFPFSCGKHWNVVLILSRVSQLLYQENLSPQKLFHLESWEVFLSKHDMLEKMLNINMTTFYLPLKWTALMSIRSKLGGKADRNSVIFPFVAFSTQSFICCRLSRTVGSDSYNRWDSWTKSCFGWNPTTHNKHNLSDSIFLKPDVKVIFYNLQETRKRMSLLSGPV